MVTPGCKETPLIRLKEMIPVPDIPATVGLLEALLVTVIAATLDPKAEGVNVTLMVQLAPTFKVEEQVFDCEKSAGLVPVTTIEEIVMVAVPLLDSVMLWLELVVPIP